jgi:hypothetical protein
LEKVFL